VYAVIPYAEVAHKILWCVRSAIGVSLLTNSTKTIHSAQSSSQSILFGEYNSKHRALQTFSNRTQERIYSIDGSSENAQTHMSVSGKISLINVGSVLIARQGGYVNYVCIKCAIVAS
jgi:hypothetical protein